MTILLGLFEAEVLKLKNKNFVKVSFDARQYLPELRTIFPAVSETATVPLLHTREH